MIIANKKIKLMGHDDDDDGIENIFKKCSKDNVKKKI